MTGAKQLLEGLLAGEPRDDIDLPRVVAEGRRRRQRRRRWVVGSVVVGTATAVVAVTVGPRLVDEAGPEPARPTLKLVPVEVLSLDRPQRLPDGALQTHHAAADFDGVTWDRWAGVTDDGYVVRIRNDATDSTRFGLVDPVTGHTEWLPEPAFDSGDPSPLQLGPGELVFLDNRRGTGAVAVYDRAAARWSSYAPFHAFTEGRRMYQSGPLTRASVDAGGRLWIKLVDAPAADGGECHGVLDAICAERWWSVPYREGGLAYRMDEYDGSSLTWEGRTGVSASVEGLTVTTPAGRATAPLAAPDGCELREGFSPVAYAASPVVLGIPCADGTTTVVVHDEAGAPLFALPAGSYGTVVAGEGYVGVVAGSGRQARLLLVDVASRRVYTVAGGPHTAFTDIGGGLVVWQSPEQGWSERDGNDYWVAELP